METTFGGPEIGSDNYFRILMSFLVVSLNDRHFLELTSFLELTRTD